MAEIINSFPGYIYKNGHNFYKDEDVGKGGYVYAEPGYYTDVIVLDSASHHPHSIIAMNCFGKYTSRFEELLEARMAIKHGDFEKAGKMLNGKLAKYLTDKDSAADLAQALKIAINSVYGLTSASFDNPFHDVRNRNNIVALRGALFMVDLKHAVQEQGFTVAHIKTDSIKIPHPTEEIIQFVKDFGLKYGYIFEEEDRYDRMCLINDAVYIAKYQQAHIDKKTGKEIWWSAVGAQFAHPYVFKSLFSKESIIFEDMCETKSVTTHMVLDMNEDLPEDQHNYIFVGKVGQFCPMVKGSKAGLLYRVQDDAYHYVAGAKGYRWMESEQVKLLGLENQIDKLYFKKLVKKAKSALKEFVDLDELLA